ncbi:RpiR family transcriptional regulator [Wenjunlia vitaminophila]|uniref:RpiR family transcriptional regulator n=1 Tax=Wenjunlia vitaminophila TaxID=76728 RepID=A0A0T6LSH6_WENVI|nr:MurR/RpiR family transcriptional regulator [Wenjunlia vitaminophila]KRV48948.1 RpiR family transcriptional regulator [Wenjunlia vitaminophila]
MNEPTRSSQSKARGSGDLSVAESITVRIRGLLPSLTPVERRVAEEVLADPGLAEQSTISELARRCQTSLTSVTRFCRALGLAGYPQLRLALAADAGHHRSRGWAQEIGGDIGPDDPIHRVLAELLEADGRALEETASQLNVEALEKAVSAMAGARRLDIYAVSGSGTVGAELHLRLHHLGFASYIWSDVHDALASAALLGGSDVAIGISHSGETNEVVEPLELARERGATAIAITNFPRSPLAEAADLVLATATRELTFRSGGLAARHAQMLVLDCLYIGVAQRAYTPRRNPRAATTRAVQRHRSRSAHEDPAGDGSGGTPG